MSGLDDVVGTDIFFQVQESIYPSMIFLFLLRFQLSVLNYFNYGFFHSFTLVGTVEFDCCPNPQHDDS